MVQENSDSLNDQPTSQTAPVKVLFVESELDAERLIQKALFADGAFQVERVATMSLALERLVNSDIEIVLASEHLPDCGGAAVFDKLRLAAPNALILPLGEIDADSDPCSDDVVDTKWLPGALQYVARRKATESAWRTADEALFEEKERARVTLGSIGDAVLVTDLQGNVTYLNQVAENLTGWPSAKAIGQPLPAVFRITDSETGRQAKNPALHAMSENTIVGLAANCMLHRFDGTEIGIEDSAAPVHDRYGQVTGAVIVFRDVNQSLTMTRKMAWLAGHDSLTGLASRALFEERFKQVIGLANRHARQAAVLFVDLNDFKQTNDVYGHSVGDHVLQVIARCLLRGVRDTDTVCRYGGDEFVILLADVAGLAAAKRAVGKLMGLFDDCLEVDGHHVKVSMSVGISMYPDDGRDLPTLIKHADIAMYATKTQAKTSPVFTPIVHDTATRPRPPMINEATGVRLTNS